MAESWYQPFKELFAHLKALGTAGAGKLGVEQGLHLTDNVALGAVGATSGTMFSAVLLGGFGAVSAVTNQIEYGAARGRIADFYREELAAKLGKSPEKVMDDDIDILAKGDKKLGIAANNAIDEEIKHQRKKRNLGIGASFVASLTVYSLMHTFIDTVAAAAAASVLPGAEVTAPLVLAGVGFAAKVALSVLAYIAIKNPLMKVGKTLFGLDADSTHDLILGIAKDRERGHAITREQVVEVFISANPQITSYVEQQYGRNYNHLPLAEKVRVASDLAKLLPADKMAHNINLGTANASELAFTVQGDVSGVLPKAAGEVINDGDQKSIISRIGNKCRNMIKAFNHTLHPEKAHPISSLTAIRKAQECHETGKIHEESPVVELNNQPSHVERLGRKPLQSEDYARALAEKRANQVHLAGTPTLQ